MNELEVSLFSSCPEIHWVPYKDVGLSAFPCQYLKVKGSAYKTSGHSDDICGQGRGVVPNKDEQVSNRFAGVPCLRGPKTTWLLQESALARKNCYGCTFLILFCHSSYHHILQSSLRGTWYHSLGIYNDGNLRVAPQCPLLRNKALLRDY